MYYNNRRNEHHIQDEQQYRDAVRNLRWNNGKGNGERWKKDELIERSNINFNEERFTPHDYAYTVNALYADYGNISEKPEYYMQMSKDYLRNDSFPERAEERAYYDARRRAARYENRYDDYYPVRYDDSYGYGNNYNYESNYNYENKRRYDRRADRDNDGRYNEGR